jgi:hypothetical protein
MAMANHSAYLDKSSFFKAAVANLNNQQFLLLYLTVKAKWLPEQQFLLL